MTPPEHSQHLNTETPEAPYQKDSVDPIAVKFQTFSLAAVERFKSNPRQWSKGERLELVPEPTNKHDKNAIKVMRHGVQVAYIAQKDTQVIAKLLQEGWELSWAFFRKGDGGHWGKGVLDVRLENPIMGWHGYNPIKTFTENYVAREQDLLMKVSQPSESKPRAVSKTPRL